LTTLGAPALQLLQIVLARSTRDAAAFILAQLDAGQALATLVTEVLAPVQVEVGERWQRNALSTADEHAATAVVDNALATLALTGSAGQFVDRGSMAVVCAEGDWHTLPARMAAELWRWDGWDVIFLGGSLPPGDLGTWLSAARPDVLAVTCSVPLFIPGTLRVGETSAAAGVPCVVGGRGLGPDARRADALGLRWAASPAGLEAALDAPPPAGRAGGRADRPAQRIAGPRVVDRGRRGRCDRCPHRPAPGDPRLHTTADVTHRKGLRVHRAIPLRRRAVRRPAAVQ